MGVSSWLESLGKPKCPSCGEALAFRRGKSWPTDPTVRFNPGTLYLECKPCKARFVKSARRDDIRPATEAEWAEVVTE